ncbi:MAG: ABC transporter ATP-binding protein, partial [Burkholderiaceae bacterium]|nr:ABC transporter ATP-binding protein [Burkholderiaceae bacterium]
QYEGTVFLVSHDRRFLDNVVTSTLAFEGDGVWREYEGDVQDWLTQSARSAPASASRPTASLAPTTDTSKKATASSAPAGNAGAPSRKKLSYKEQRELDALPALLAALEDEQQRIDQELADGQLYTTEPVRAAALAARHAAIDDELLAALERQEALTGQ